MKTSAYAFIVSSLFSPSFLFSQGNYEIEKVIPEMERHPSLSPNGRDIVYCTGTGFDLDLKILTIETGETQKLADTECEDSHPRWSPDGKWIVFQREELNGNTDIHLMDSDGKNSKNLTNTNEFREQYPSFSPDGLSVVFDANRDEEDLDSDDQNYEIYHINLSDLNIKRLTFLEQWDMYPSFNENGTELVWRRTLIENGEEYFEIFVKNLESNELRNITNHPGYDSNPHWSPIGDLITFSSSRDNGLNIYTIRPNGSQIAKVTQGEKGIMGFGVPTLSYDGKVIMADRYIEGATDMVQITINE